MKDSRLVVFRAAVDGLIESLEAVIRLSRWTGPESKPEPLVASASKLLERLGAASRLSASKFQGTANDVGKVDAICAILKRLDAAYLSYRQDLEAPQGTTGSADSIAALETELAKATSAAAAWR